MTDPASTRVILSDATVDRAWDDFVQATPGGDHVQSSGWAQTKAWQGLTVARVVVQRDGRIVAGAQLLIKRMPLAGGIGYVPRGPVVSGVDEGLARVVVEQLQELAVRRRIRHLVVQPGRNGDWIAELLPSRGFVPSALSVAATATVLIDLSADVDELFGALGKSARKHVRRGRREGVEIREGGGEDLSTFHALMSSTSHRHGFTPYSRDYFGAMWRALRPGGHIRLFLAEYHGEAVSAQLVVPFGELFLSKVAAWSGAHAGVYPNEALDWYLIQWAKEHGFRYYDMEGIERETAEHMVIDPTARPTRTADAFKLKFGGDVVLLPTAFDYFPSSLVAHTYGRAYRRMTVGGWPRAGLARLRTRSGKNGLA